MMRHVMVLWDTTTTMRLCTDKLAEIFHGHFGQQESAVICSLIKTVEVGTRVLFKWKTTTYLKDIFKEIDALFEPHLTTDESVEIISVENI